MDIYTVKQGFDGYYQKIFYNNKNITITLRKTMIMLALGFENLIIKLNLILVPSIATWINVTFKDVCDIQTC